MDTEIPEHHRDKPYQLFSCELCQLYCPENPVKKNRTRHVRYPLDFNGRINAKYYRFLRDTYRYQGPHYYENHFDVS